MTFSAQVDYAQRSWYTHRSVCARCTDPSHLCPRGESLQAAFVEATAVQVRAELRLEVVDG